MAALMGVGMLRVVFLRAILELARICLCSGVAMVRLVLLRTGWEVMLCLRGVGREARCILWRGRLASISILTGVASFLPPTESSSSSPSPSSSSELKDRKLSSKPVMEYSSSSSSPSLLLSVSSSTSSMTSLTWQEVGRERRVPMGTDPVLMGVLGGKRLSKNSGESMGPKVTLLRVLFLAGSSSVLVVTSR